MARGIFLKGSAELARGSGQGAEAERSGGRLSPLVWAFAGVESGGTAHFFTNNFAQGLYKVT
jgi:hypothetical protein